MNPLRRVQNQSKRQKKRQRRAQRPPVNPPSPTSDEGSATALPCGSHQRACDYSLAVSASSQILAPEKAAKDGEQQNRKKQKAATSVKNLTSKGQTKKHHLTKALNALRKIAEVEIDSGSGSRVSLQLGKKKSGFHSPHGSDSNVLDKKTAKDLGHKMRAAIQDSKP